VDWNSNVILTNLPLNLFRFKKLKKLDISNNNRLKSLPEVLWILPELEELTIDSRLFKFIPRNRIDHKNKWYLHNDVVLELLLAWKNKLPIGKKGFFQLLRPRDGVVTVKLKKVEQAKTEEIE
jgi:hypothetical protein